MLLSIINKKNIANILIIRELYINFSNTEMRNVKFILPQKGKDITVSISGINENGLQYDGVDYIYWNGENFYLDGMNEKQNN